MISQEFLALIMSIAAGMKDEGREIKTVKSEDRRCYSE